MDGRNRFNEINAVDQKIVNNEHVNHDKCSRQKFTVDHRTNAHILETFENKE